MNGEVLVILGLVLIGMIISELLRGDKK